MKQCPHCKKARLVFDEEKLHGACIHCLYGMAPDALEIVLPGHVEKEPLQRILRPHPLVERLVIPPKKYAQLMTYCKLARTEVSGLAEIKLMPDKSAVLTSVALLDQDNTFASTDISEQTLHNFTLSMARRGRDLSTWRVWWHTHYNFSTFWSQTDEDNIKKLCRFFNGYLISLELNQSGATLARLDEKRTQFELELSVEHAKYPDLEDTCRKHLKRRCKERPIVLNNNWQRSFLGGYYGH